jgi:serine/threonine-protein kinase
MVNRGEGVRIIISSGLPSPVVASGSITPSIPGRRQVEPDLTDVSISVLDQPRRPQENVRPERSNSTGVLQNDPHFPEFSLPGGTTTTPSQVTPTEPDEPTLTTTPTTETRNRVARIRYQVPPILRPLPLRIEIEDNQGKRVLLERNARSSETIQIDGAYSQEAMVHIWLGGESVWEERFR